MSDVELETALADHDAYHDSLAMESIEEQDYADLIFGEFGTVPLRWVLRTVPLRWMFGVEA